MKKILLVGILILSLSFVNLSKTVAQTNLSQRISKPYIITGSSFYRIKIIDNLNSINLKSEFIELTHRFGVNTMFAEIENDTVFNYYWEVTDDIYLNNIKGLSPELSSDTFNALTSPIQNQDFSETPYHLNFIRNQYRFNLYPLSLYKMETMRSDVVIFSENTSDLDRFIESMDPGLVTQIEKNPLDAQPTYVETLIRSQNPLTILALALVLISLYIIIYNDRRNLSIQLLNGYSKPLYFKDEMWLLLRILTGIFFFLFCIVSFKEYTHFLLILWEYFKIVLIFYCLVALFIFFVYF